MSLLLFCVPSHPNHARMITQAPGLAQTEHSPHHPMPRAVRDCVLSPAEAAELVFIARALGVVGYRAAVASATLHDVAAAAPALLQPLVAARERVRAAAEEALGLGLGLLVEFTGLISWRPGSSIAPHHDANRCGLPVAAVGAATAAAAHARCHAAVSTATLQAVPEAARVCCGDILERSGA